MTILRERGGGQFWAEIGEVVLAALFFEEFFYFEGGHAAGSGSGDGLAVAAVLDVSAGVDAVQLDALEGGEDVVLGLDVAVAVEVQLAFEHAGVRDVADGEEEEGDGQGPASVCFSVEELEAFKVLLFDAEALFDDGVVEELDLGVGDGALQHDAGGAEVFATVDDRDLGGEAGEEDGFFHGGVATADDGDLFSAGEEAVAGGAGADAEADQGLLGGEAKPAGAGSARDDERAGLDNVFADAEGEGRGGEVDGGEVGHAELGSEADGLLLHVLDELGTLDAIGPAGEVFDQGGDGELAAGLVALEDEGLEVGAGGVDGGGEASAAGAENDRVADFVRSRHRDLIVKVWKRVRDEQWLVVREHRTLAPLR
jgi:hypothetical protein